MSVADDNCVKDCEIERIFIKTENIDEQDVTEYENDRVEMFRIKTEISNCLGEHVELKRDSDIEEIFSRNADSEFDSDGYSNGELEESAPKKPRLNEWIWETKNANIIQEFHFSGSPGVNSEMLESLLENPNELDVFKVMLPNHFWCLISRETNKIANANGNDSKSEGWFPCTPDEIQAYFALTVLIAQMGNSRISSYWSTRASKETPGFGRVMSRQRFVRLLQNLNFCDNEAGQLRILVDYVNKRFRKLYYPERDLVIRETLVNYLSRSLPDLRHAAYGVKVYEISESSSGYCLQLDMYSGEVPSSETVVMNLIKAYTGKGHTLHVDIQYSSPSLFLKLVQQETNAIGVVHPLRRNMPKHLRVANVDKNEVRVAFCRSVTAFKWVYKKEEQYLLSTCHSDEGLVECGRVTKGTRKMVLMPRVVLDYSNGMDSWEKYWLHLRSFAIKRGYIKNQQKIFYYLVDLALFNSCILYNHLTGSEVTVEDFRRRVAERLLDSVKLPNYTRSETRLLAVNWGHFPRHILPDSYQIRPSRKCKVCKARGIKSDRSTRFECKKCLEPLHVPDCFKIFHTSLNF
ncbi:hypothetical protein ANN_04712 [Periplaneta americana]|uniref:PiggyBac transposable element-derived protein domain-containing protein n=1 Tax=Periplaneta americana TaxID=6978 RepID=A0ABQ8TB00_PERAM|nr:hypothetical protein ANN_04712 [Periplaneta americana]